MKVKKILMTTGILLVIMSGCQKEEIYEPIKETGKEANVENIEDDSKKENLETQDEKEEIIENYRVNVDDLNLREEASFNSGVITGLDYGDEVKFLEKTYDLENNEWYKINVFKNKNYYTGYVSSEYLDEVGE